MSNLTQMLGLTVHNFLSAATGLAMAFALARGFTRSSATTVGNFWVDLARITLYRPAADRFRPRLRQHRVGRASDACRRRRGEDLGRREAGPLDRPDGQPGGNQAARHQRRRLLQRQFRASVREPQHLDRYPADRVAPAHPGSDCSRFWPGGRRPAPPGTRHSRDDGRFSAGRCRSRLLGGTPAIRFSPRSAWTRSAGNLEGKEIRFGQALSALFTVATTGTGTGAVTVMHRTHDAARRPRADVQHSGRLHLAGRRRRGALRLSGGRDHRGVRRRADGRPHAGVSRQPRERPRHAALRRGRRPHSCGDNGDRGRRRRAASERHGHRAC